MRTPQDLRSRAAAAYRRSAAAWAVDPEAAESARLVLGLAPPTEREALAGAQAVADWAARQHPALRLREASSRRRVTHGALVAVLVLFGPAN